MTVRSLVAALIVAATVGSAHAADLKVICANGMRAVVTELQPQLERATGQSLVMSFGEAGELRRRIEAGETADVIVLPKVVLDRLEASVVPETKADISKAEMGMGVKAGTPKPDISTADGLKRTLLAARSIAITDPDSGGVSGVHMADVFRRLGIADELKPRLKLNRGGPNALFITRGEAEIAFQLAHEIRIVPGIDFIPLPVEFQSIYVFSTGVGSRAAAPEAAKTMVRFLASPAAVPAIRAKYMEPVAAR